MNPEGLPIKFPLGAGGPFYRLQIALRLRAEDRPNVLLRVCVAWFVTWVPLALLGWLEPAVADNQGHDTALIQRIFSDIATYARFFVTIPLLVVAENAVRPHLERAFEQAVITGVVPQDRQRRFFTMLLLALQWRESRKAEAVILGLAYLAAHLALWFASREHRDSWIFAGESLTWAGGWYAYVSLPALQFLVFRWIFRLMIWWRVMYGLSRMGLAIMPAHPDERGGLAFIGDSVQAFGILALAFSAAAAGAVADYVVNAGLSLTELKGFIAGAALFILFLFLAPLGFFLGPLFKAKEEALRCYEGLAERFWQAFDRKWIRSDASVPTPDQIAQADFSALADLATPVKMVREMKLIPLTREGFLPLALAIVIPFLPVLAVVFPLDELLKGVLHVFLGRVE